MRFLSRIYGYYPSNAEDIWQAEALIDNVEDFFTNYFIGFNNPEDPSKWQEFFDWLPLWLKGI